MKNSAQLETGITASSTIGGGSNFAIGCKYALDKDAAVRAKVDTNSQVSQQNITLLLKHSCLLSIYLPVHEYRTTFILKYVHRTPELTLIFQLNELE